MSTPPKASATLHDEPEVAVRAGPVLVELVLGDVAPRRRDALLALELLVAEGDRRVRQPHVVERGRLLLQRARRELGRDVVLALEVAAHVAGADAQLEDRRHVRRLGHRERMLDHLDHASEVGPRVDQQHRALQREGVRALLDHRSAFAVVFADDDQRAAGDARRSEVGQRVAGDVGADDRLPGHRAAQWVVDRRAEHRGGRRLVGARLDVHAEFVEVRARLHHHVE